MSIDIRGIIYLKIRSKMGIFSVKPHSSAEIEPHVSFFDEMRTGYYGNTLYIASAEGRLTFGSFNYFHHQGHYLLNKTVKLGDNKIPGGWLGTVDYNMKDSAFDTKMARVTIPNSKDPFMIVNSHTRLVDVSDKPFESFVEGGAGRSADYKNAIKAFCTNAIAKATFEHLNGVVEPAWMREKIDKARAAYEAAEPQFQAHLDSYLARVAGITPQTIDFGNPGYSTE
jgi:hypothetical protein